MMRKFLIGLMLSSALAAVVIGSALAWTGSSTGSASATAGSIAFTISPYNVHSAARVVDNNTPVNVADGGIQNTGDIAVQVTGGTVTPTGDAAACLVTGTVVVDDGSFINPGSGSGGLYHVNLSMPQWGSNNYCQGKTLPYDVTINVAS